MSRHERSWIANTPNLVVSGLSISGRVYVAYLADARELTDPAVGRTIAGRVSLLLPAGNYDVSLYSPMTGESSPAIAMQGGTKSELALPTFSQDIVCEPHAAPNRCPWVSHSNTVV